MKKVAFFLVALVVQWFQPRYNAKLQLLKAQIRILRTRIDTNRIVPTPAEKDELLRIGESIEHDVADARLVRLARCHCDRKARHGRTLDAQVLGIHVRYLTGYSPFPFRKPKMLGLAPLAGHAGQDFAVEGDVANSNLVAGCGRLRRRFRHAVPLLRHGYLHAAEGGLNLSCLL